MKPLALAWLLIGVLVALPAQESPLVQASVSPTPGAYQAPVKLVVRGPEGALIRYRFLETPTSASFPWTDGLVLDALPGETRTYGLRLTTDLPSGETVTRDYRYQVSREAVPTPTVQPEPGRYWSAVSVRADLPPQWKVLENGLIPAFPRTLDAAPGRTATFVFDAKGPQGQSMSWTYTVDRRDQEVVGLDVVSPVEGEWANAQPLIAVFRGVDRVLWSYGDRLDTRESQDYEGPIVLDRPGRQTVTVAGRSRTDGRWIERTVTWTNGTARAPVEGWPSSGVKIAGLTIPAAPGYSVSWDEGRSWQSSQSVTETASTTSRKLLSLQVRQTGIPYRFVYWLDARAPDGPSSEFLGGWNPRLVFSGPTEAAYRVSWTRADGFSVDEPGLLWGPVGSWKVPDGMVAAQVRVTGTNGLEGRPSTVGFAETGWSTPLWEPWDQQGPQSDKTILPLGGRLLPRPGFWPVYEVSDRPDVAEPDTSSPLLEGAFLPTFPWGGDRTLYARFAWRDAGGLIGPGSPVVAVRVDRVPPPAPEVLTLGGQVLVKVAEGEEEGGALVWAVTPDRVSSAESLTFQPYRGPIDTGTLKSNGGKIWFHAQAQDRSGNSGATRLNVALAPPTDQESRVVQVDLDPAIGEAPVENGGVYPWSTFRLRALDQGKDLWVGVTDQGALPTDWATKVQPWTGILSRGIARGERRTFQIFWNAKTATGWAWPQPKTLSLTLDLSAPVRPILGAWPQGPQGSAWTLEMKAGRTGDSLRYTYTLDGSLPADPLVAGEPWPGSRTWDAPSAGWVVVRVRVAAVSVSGLAVETTLDGPVVVDRAPPSSVIPALEPFTYRSAPFTVPVPESSALVRYTLTSDGRLPEVPTASSPALSPRGLLLEGQEGASVLYRFRWRSFSQAGIPGQVTDTFGVLIDRTARLTAAPPSSAGNGKMPPPRMAGLPPLGLTALPVILTADNPGGLLRFEVREGVGEPRPVTAESALWKDPLVLDPGEGVDRSYAVTLRGFSSDGRPVTDEVSFSLRIDRSAPVLPQIDLVSDPRRPEATLRNRTDRQNPEEVLHYRWLWDAFGQGQGEGAWITLGTAPAVFSAPEGALTKLRLQAYLRDEAGNVGPTTELGLLIDQNVVYLAPQATGDGTRARPMGSVVGALDRARREGKALLMVAAGNYAVAQTLDLGGLQIFGGLKADSWETTPEPGRSLWSASNPFDGSSLIESSDRDWALSHVDLTTGTTRLAQVVLVRGADVTVKDASWNWGGAAKGWDQEGGRVDLTNVVASYAAEPLGGFLDWKSLEATVRGFRVAASLNQGGLLVSLKSCVALFQDLAVVSKKASGFDGIWSASDSQLTVDQAKIQAGDGAERATAFVLKNTDAVFWTTEVSLYGSLSNTGYQVTGGRLELQKGSLGLLKGREFNQGLVLDDSRTMVRFFDLRIESGAYQGGLSVAAGTLNLGASKITLAGGGQRVWGAQFLSPVLVTMEDSTWVLSVKTTGDLWKLEKPWMEGSKVVGSRSTGW